MATKKSEIISVRERVSDAEWTLRVDLAACYRMVAHYGWEDQIFTHISARVPGPEQHFLINPFGMFFDEITASSLVKVDLSGQLVMESDYFVNPAGFVIHGAIHGAREDAHCVLHTHTPAGMAVSVQEDGLLPLTQSAMSVCSDLAYHDYEGIVLDDAERQRLLPNVGDKNNVILRNHGLLTMGKTVGDAFLRMYFLEKACQAQFMAQSSGGKLIYPSEGVPEKVQMQSDHGMIGGMSLLNWQAVLRKAERIDPGFKE